MLPTISLGSDEMWNTYLKTGTVEFCVLQFCASFVKFGLQGGSCILQAADVG